MLGLKMYRLHYDLRISYKHLLIIVGNNDKQIKCENTANFWDGITRCTTANFLNFPALS